MRWFLLVAPLAGCVTLAQHRAVETRVAELETELTALQERLNPLLPPSEAEEAAAGVAFDEAMAALEDLRIDEAKAKLGRVLAEFPNTQAGEMARAMAGELAVVGRDAVTLEVERWFQGSDDDLADDKATLYVFWEVWCPHCQREVPKLSATYDKYAAQGLGIVGITEMTRDITSDDVDAFIADNGVTYPVVKEVDQALARQYGVRGIPAAALVRNDKVVWRGHPATLSDDLIEKMLLP